MQVSLSVSVGHKHWTTPHLELEVFVSFLVAGNWTQDLYESSIALNQNI